MAESRPASTHSWRNTEFRTWRAAGFRPNDTLDSPSTVKQPGISALMRRIASMVAMASRRRSSSPVDSGNVSASKMRSARFEAVPVDRDVGDAVGDADLPLDVACLALLVDDQADDGRAVLAGEGEHAVEPGAGRLAVLQVGRVEHGPAADPLEARPP